MNYETSVSNDGAITCIVYDAPITVTVESTPKIVTVDYPPRILIGLTEVQQVQTGGGSGGSNSRVFNFVDADLDVNGNITFTHNLDKTYVDYSVYMPSIGEVFADSDGYALNQLTINLKSYRPLNGLWTILIEV